MTKTPDEIKKGLACCAESIYQCADDCPYKEQCRNEQGGKAMNENALALIQQLQAENAEKADRIKKLEAERDALSEELKNAHSCFACKKFRRNGGECCGGSVCMMRDFEWRGIQKEATP